MVRAGLGLEMDDSAGLEFGGVTAIVGGIRWGLEAADAYDRVLACEVWEETVFSRLVMVVVICFTWSVNRLISSAYVFIS